MACEVFKLARVPVTTTVSTAPSPCATDCVVAVDPPLCADAADERAIANAEAPVSNAACSEILFDRLIVNTLQSLPSFSPGACWRSHFVIDHRH
jgi:hypothetical protein